MLNSEERIRVTRPADLLRAAGAGPGSTVVDYGSGPGFLTIPAAEVVGPTGRPSSRALRSPPASPVGSVTATSRSWPARRPEMTPHTDLKFHRQLTQIGCYWGNGGHTELYLLEGDRLALIDTGVADTPAA